jgi:hypothetical protein
MRQYDIVFGILLSLSIIDFALTAPVPEQEKLHARVGAMHIPKHVITVLEKRGNDDLVAADFLNWVKAVQSSDGRASSSSALPGPDYGSKTDVAHASSSSALPGFDHGQTDVTAPAPNPASLTVNPDPLMEPSSLSSTGSSMAGGYSNLDKFAKLAKEYYKTWQKPVESSDPHLLSSSAPLGLDHWSKTDEPAPAPNRAPSTVNPAPLMEPASLSWTRFPMAGGSGNYDDFAKQAKEYFETRRKAYVEKQRDAAKSTEAHASSSSALPGLDHGSKDDVPAPPPNPASSTASASSLPPTAPGMDATLQDKWWYDGPHGPTYTPMSLGYDSDRVSTGVNAPKPNRNRLLSENPYFAWNYLMKNPPPLRPTSVIEFGQTHGKQAEHVQDTNPGQPTDSDVEWDHWMDNLPSPKRLKLGWSNELDGEAVQGPPSPEWQ